MAYRNSLSPLIGALLLMGLLVIVHMENPALFFNPISSDPDLFHYQPEFCTKENLAFQTNLFNLNLEQTWNKSYAYGLYSQGYAVIECASGGYAIVGASELFHSDIWLLRIDKNGTLLWNSTYDGGGQEWGYDIVECPDNGFALLGFSGESYSLDMFLVRTDSDGNQLWSQSYDIGRYEVGYSIVSCMTGGFAILGSVDDEDTWLLRLDDDGEPLWNHTYALTLFHSEDTLVECQDGGFAFVGSSELDPIYSADYLTVSLIRTNPEGTLVWNRTYSGGWPCSVRGLVACRDGGFAFVGHNVLSIDPDFWLMRVDSSGFVLWNQTYVRPYEEYAEAIIETWFGGFAFVGHSFHWSSGISDTDVKLIVTDREGQPLVDWTIPGQNFEEGYSLIECHDRGIAIAGTTSNVSESANWNESVLLIRIPGVDNQDPFLGLSWIGLVVVLPIFVCVIIILTTIWLFKSKKMTSHSKK